MQPFRSSRLLASLAAGLTLTVALALFLGTPSAQSPQDKAATAEPRYLGGEADSTVQVANLVYAGIRSSHCFSDHFLLQAERDSAISTSRRFHAVKLSSDEVFGYPLVIMTGEGAFALPDRERENL